MANVDVEHASGRCGGNWRRAIDDSDLGASSASWKHAPHGLSNMHGEHVSPCGRRARLADPAASTSRRPSGEHVSPLSKPNYRRWLKGDAAGGAVVSRARVSTERHPSRTKPLWPAVTWTLKAAPCAIARHPSRTQALWPAVTWALKAAPCAIARHPSRTKPLGTPVTWALKAALGKTATRRWARSSSGASKPLSPNAANKGRDSTARRRATLPSR